MRTKELWPPLSVALLGVGIIATGILLAPNPSPEQSQGIYTGTTSSQAQQVGSASQPGHNKNNGEQEGKLADPPRLLAQDPLAATATLCNELIKTADTVLVTTPTLTPEQAHLVQTVTSTTALPVLPADTADLAGHLNRLQTKRVLGVGDAADLAWLGIAAGRELLRPLPGETPEQLHTRLGAVNVTPTDTPRPTVWISQEQQAAYTGALATARAGQAKVDVLPVADPRQRFTLFRTPSDNPPTLIALGSDFGDQASFDSKLALARTAPEVMGGGLMVFPGRRMIAAYGHPGTPSLGILGEQDAQATVTRIGTLADEYSRLLPGEKVLKAFEIIITVAANNTDDTYSTKFPIEKIEPWIDTITAAGGYAMLDLQPGRQDFLTQAKLYEPLLKRPNVGLALDPEWRLKPGQRHLVQIGSVDASELNQVSEWLAGVVRENNLPQKVLTLHQFSRSMITNRQALNTNHPELAFLLHVDGQGGQEAKQGTWKLLREDLPPNIFMGWKNFYDEDSPMLTPEQTVKQVHPLPWFISYQ